jgi:hypothetical protein
LPPLGPPGRPAAVGPADRCRGVARGDAVRPLDLAARLPARGRWRGRGRPTTADGSRTSLVRGAAIGLLAAPPLISPPRSLARWRSRARSVCSTASSPPGPPRTARSGGRSAQRDGAASRGGPPALPARARPRPWAAADCGGRTGRCRTRGAATATAASPPSSGRPSPTLLALVVALAGATAAVTRLDVALAGHPLARAFLYRARLDAVRRRAAPGTGQVARRSPHFSRSNVLQMTHLRNPIGS